VLDEIPANQDVFSDTERIGSLFARVEINYGSPIKSNEVDCALAKLDGVYRSVPFTDDGKGDRVRDMKVAVRPPAPPSNLQICH
jgi:hypothetical protein